MNLYRALADADFQRSERDSIVVDRLGDHLGERLRWRRDTPDSTKVMPLTSYETLRTFTWSREMDAAGTFLH
jgi:hypothetical protein